jgi:hypothetical protein
MKDEMSDDRYRLAVARAKAVPVVGTRRTNGVVLQDLAQKLLAEMIVLRDDDTFT